jgi:hypothetical protein
MLAYVVVDSPAAQSPPAGWLTHAPSLRMQSLCNLFGTFTHPHVGLHTISQTAACAQALQALHANPKNVSARFEQFMCQVCCLPGA